MVNSVKSFISIFKQALLKFYRLTHCIRSQEDTLDRWITDRILDTQVSYVLF
jgi:hypothetical protein